MAIVVRLRSSVPALLLVLVVPFCAYAQSGGAPGSAPTPDEAAQLERQFDELEKKVGENGTVRVLLTFAMIPQWEPEGKKDWAVGQAQIGRIRERQRAILAALGIRHDTPGVALFDLPGMGLSVNAHHLSMLRKMPEIRHIAEPAVARIP